MKVLFLTNIPSPYRVDFFNELGKNCDLTVVFEGKNATDRNENWQNRESFNFNFIFLNGFRIKSDQFICLSIIKILKQQWDKIVVCGYSSPTIMLAILYLKLKKISFYIEVDGGLIKQDSLSRYKIKKYFLSSAIGWFSSGKETTRYLVHYGADKNRVIEYQFTSLKEQDILKQLPTEQEKKNLKKDLNLKEEKIILCVGRFSYNLGYGKGYDILMKTSEMLSKKIGIYIVGDEPTEEFVLWKNNKNLDNVNFVGFKTKEELKKYYKAADLFVLPTRGDVWGLVINEAMAMGVPVITTDKCVAGLELVENGVNGYIVPTENSEILTEKINKIFNEDYKQMGQNSLNKIRKYTIENMGKKHMEEFSKKL